MIKKLKLYGTLIRLDKPIGIWLTFFPALWSLIWVCPNYQQFLHFLPFFFGGAVIARSLGCLINDMVDRKFDGQVSRTQERPLAKGVVSPIEASMVGLGLGIIGLYILCHLNKNAIIWGLGVVPLICLYPFCKRWTYWPQVFLAITFNWGALLASVAVTGTLKWGAIVLYGASAFWTLAYDTIYAYQDLQDDVKIGIKSTAIKFGYQTKRWVALFFILFYGGLILTFPHPFTRICHGIGCLYTLLQLQKWNPQHLEQCQKLFRQQGLMGLYITLGIILPLLCP